MIHLLRAQQDLRSTNPIQRIPTLSVCRSHQYLDGMGYQHLPDLATRFGSAVRYAYSQATTSFPGFSTGRINWNGLEQP